MCNTLCLPQIVIPTQVLNNWCCYFLDFKKRCIHIVDPLYNDEEATYYRKLHDPLVDNVCAEMAFRIKMFYNNWTVQWTEWSKEYIVHVVQAKHR